MPFVVRRSKEEIMANPELAKTDKEATRSCRIYELYPTNVTGFIEGTRIDKAKYEKSGSRFKKFNATKNWRYGLHLRSYALYRSSD